MDDVGRLVKVWVWQTPCTCDTAVVEQAEMTGIFRCPQCKDFFKRADSQLVTEQDIYYETVKDPSDWT